MSHFLLLAILAMAGGAIITVRAINGEANNLTARSAAELYAKNCASCHGKDGRAKTLKGKIKHARNLTDPTWANKVDDERLFNTIMNGKGKCRHLARTSPYKRSTRWLLTFAL